MAHGLDKALKGVFHWTDAGLASWYDFAMAIQEEAIHTGLLDQAIPIHPIPAQLYPTPDERPFYAVLDQDLVESLLVIHKIDTIIHFAAESHVDRSILGPDEFINTNIVGTHTLLKAARKIRLDGKFQNHRFHHISTDEVYGSLKPDDPPFSEKTAYRPNSPYAAGKSASDHLVGPTTRPMVFRSPSATARTTMAPSSFRKS